ncbi:zinc finger protein OZF-like [Diabrotica virgifera virgifera]|uniref:Zinc finger protein OZF-like n=1 Tax=Diabrotica virgifera virgifera TaxID=50390 RepID=A0A6P7F5T7_DIAVI|nr:zinc finger protein OZF-like [Diabrotica virgifera virgifera]
MVTSKTAPHALKVTPSQNQLLMTKKTSPPVLKVISKVLMASNTVGSGPTPPMKVIPTKNLINHPTTLSNVHPSTQVVIQSERVSPIYINPFDYTPYVKNTLSPICRLKIFDAAKGERNLMQEKVFLFAWTCKICRKEFPEKEHLLEHYEMHKNTTDQLGDIDENNDTYTIGSKEVTLNPICMTTYTNIARYQQHVAQKHKPKDHYCDTCKHTFTDDFYLSIHKSTHNQDPGLYECVICKKFQTKNTKTLYEHISKEHVKEEMYCNECDKTFLSRTWFEDHKIFHEDINKRHTYKCRKCESTFTFTSNYSLMEHMQESHIKYKCNQCDVTFPYKQNLDKHNSHLHLTEGKFICNECGEAFTKLSTLRFHEIIHKAGKHVCSVCGKMFKKKVALNLHMRGHTGEKPYSCNFCDKAFAQRNVYYTHRRIHTGERPFSCSECKNSFTDRSALRQP